MTPSKRRRMGKEAFIPFEDVNKHIPTKWKKVSYMVGAIQDFKEGWEQAEKEWEQEQFTNEDNVQPYPETHSIGTISFEQDIKRGTMHGDIGIQIAEDGRIWICIDGQALIRFKSMGCQPYR